MDKRRKLEEKEAQREAKEAQKEAKQAERKRKQEEKEEDKRRKKEEREANRKKSKEESLAEVVVVLDSAWAEDVGGDELVSFLVGRGIQTRLEEAVVSNSATWLRTKGNSEIEESHLVVKLDAKEVSDLVLANKLGNFASEITQRFPNKKLAFIIEGMDDFMRNQSNAAAKDYRKMVQDRMEGKDANASAKPKAKLTKAALDEALVWLQIEANCNVKSTNTVLETADYLFRLTGAIAHAPYKPQSTFENFCAEAMRKKSGSGSMEETWLAQLQQINGVSYNVARCIVNQYPTVKSLTKHYLNDTLSIQDKEQLLQDIRVESGTGTGRRLGGVLSKKIYQIFTVDDPTVIIN